MRAILFRMSAFLEILPVLAPGRNVAPSKSFERFSTCAICLARLDIYGYIYRVVQKKTIPLEKV